MLCLQAPRAIWSQLGIQWKAAQASPKRGGVALPVTTPLTQTGRLWPLTGLQSVEPDLIHSPRDALG